MEDFGPGPLSRRARGLRKLAPELFRCTLEGSQRFGVYSSFVAPKSYLGRAPKCLGVEENERNLTNKISRGGFTAAFLVQRLEAIGANEIRLS